MKTLVAEVQSFHFQIWKAEFYSAFTDTGYECIMYFTAGSVSLSKTQTFHLLFKLLSILSFGIQLLTEFLVRACLKLCFITC